MNPIELNQLTLNHAMRVHNNCMETCLEPESEQYKTHAAIREMMIAECNAMGRHARRFEQHAQRFDVPYPARVRFARIREARRAGA